MCSVLCLGTRHSKSFSLLFMEREPFTFVPVKFCPLMCPPTTASASCTGRCRAVRALLELSSKAQCPDSRAFHGVITKDLSICLVEMHDPNEMWKMSPWEILLLHETYTTLQMSSLRNCHWGRFCKVHCDFQPRLLC